MSVSVNFARVKDKAIIPSKRDEDMGFDIYACFDEDYIEILPHETKLIPTGIASACDPGYGFVLFERGSTGSKGIARRCGVIDSGYRDEWFVGITNSTDKRLYISKIPAEKFIEEAYKDDITKAYDIVFGSLLGTMEEFIKENVIIYPYEKAIVQALVLPVPKTIVNEMSYEDLKNIKSERGMGALGSSNK